MYIKTDTFDMNEYHACEDKFEFENPRRNP